MAREFALVLARLNDGKVRKLVFYNVDLDEVSLRMFLGEPCYRITFLKTRGEPGSVSDSCSGSHVVCLGVVDILGGTLAVTRSLGYVEWP